MLLSLFLLFVFYYLFILFSFKIHPFLLVFGYPNTVYMYKNTEDLVKSCEG